MITYFVALLVERLPMSNFTELQVANRNHVNFLTTLDVDHVNLAFPLHCSGSLGTRL